MIHTTHRKFNSGYELIKSKGVASPWWVHETVRFDDEDASCSFVEIHGGTQVNVGYPTYNVGLDYQDWKEALFNAERINEEWKVFKRVRGEENWRMFLDSITW